MKLTLRIYRNEDEGGVVEVVKRKSPMCFKPVGGIVFEDQDDLRYILDVFTRDHPGTAVEEREGPLPSCPLCSYGPDEH